MRLRFSGEEGESWTIIIIIIIDILSGSGKILGIAPRDALPDSRESSERRPEASIQKRHLWLRPSLPSRLRSGYQDHTDYLLCRRAVNCPMDPGHANDRFIA